MLSNLSNSIRGPEISDLLVLEYPHSSRAYFPRNPMMAPRTRKPLPNTWLQAQYLPLTQLPQRRFRRRASIICLRPKRQCRTSMESPTWSPTGQGTRTQILAPRTTAQTALDTRICPIMHQSTTRTEVVTRIFRRIVRWAITSHNHCDDPARHKSEMSSPTSGHETPSGSFNGQYKGIGE